MGINHKCKIPKKGGCRMWIKKILIVNIINFKKLDVCMEDGGGNGGNGGNGGKSGFVGGPPNITSSGCLEMVGSSIWI